MQDLRRITRTIITFFLVMAFSQIVAAAEALPTESAALRAVPETVQIDGASLRLDAYAWRDFQPISPPGGRPLRVRVRVIVVPGASVPDGLRIDALSVMQGDRAWALDVEPAPPLGTVEVLGANGPKLDPGGEIDVVVRLVTGAGESYLLRAADVSVHRTD